MQGGQDMAGNALVGAPPRFCAGAVVNPGATDLEGEIGRMQAKADAGAAFFQTQAVYDVASYERFARRTQDLEVPVLAGIILLKSTRMARWMNDKVPGIEVPQPLMARIANATDARAVSVDIAVETINALHRLCRGVHLMALGWEDLLPDVLARVTAR